MKAIILSAGQGKRLFPYTEDTPKCLLPLAAGTSLLSWQLGQLAAVGIEEAVVVSGFRAPRVETELARCRQFIRARSLYNPDYAASENLKSVWSARDEMEGDFILLNGDTLFVAPVLETLLGSPPGHPITVTISRKDRYDSDDMKVHLEATRLTRIGKDLESHRVNAESIGIILFRAAGPEIFRRAVEETIGEENGDQLFYLSVIDRLARRMPIAAAEVPAERWCEVDFPVDLQRARQKIAEWEAEVPVYAAAEAS